MGDTSVYLTVHDCPPHQARYVLDLIDDHQLDDGEDTPEGVLVLGTAYVSYSAGLGDVEDIRSRLRRDATLAAWTVYDTPSDEGLGTLIVYTPADGEWRAECGVDGDPMFDREEIRRAVDEGEVAVLLGDPWFDTISAMPAGEVIEPRRYPVTWDRKAGTIVVEVDEDEVQVPQVVKRKLVGDIAADRAPLGAALLEAGYVLAEAWASYDRSARLHEAEVYRVDDFAPAGWRWCAKCDGLILDVDAPGLRPVGGRGRARRVGASHRRAQY